MSGEVHGTHQSGGFSHDIHVWFSWAWAILHGSPSWNVWELGLMLPSDLQLSIWGRPAHHWLTISLPSVAIPLKSELAYEIFDKGQVRFWLQAEHLSPDASFRFVINDREVSDSEVSSWMWTVVQSDLDLLGWEWTTAQRNLGLFGSFSRVSVLCSFPPFTSSRNRSSEGWLDG